jgi:hypothetical protein
VFGRLPWCLIRCTSFRFRTTEGFGRLKLCGALLAHVAAKLFFVVLELLIIAAGIYLFCSGETLFAYKGKKGDTYLSANLCLAMVVII